LRVHQWIVPSFRKGEGRDDMNMETLHPDFFDETVLTDEEKEIKKELEEE